MTLGILGTLLITSSLLSAAEPTFSQNWRLDGKGLDLQTATLQAAVRASTQQRPVPNDPALHGWTLQSAQRDLALKSTGETLTCAIPLLPTPLPGKNFATRDLKLGSKQSDPGSIHQAMPTCKP